VIVALSLFLAASSDDIVVTATRKLEDWRAVLVFENDVPHCKVIKRTDTATLDAIGCTSMLQCFDAARPKFLALSDKTLSTRARKQMRVTANRDMETCFKTTRHRLIIDWANQRLRDRPDADDMPKTSAISIEGSVV